MRIFWQVALPIFILIIINGCNFQLENKPPISISLNPWPGYAYVFVAQEKGFFAKNGVDVKLVFKEEAAKSFELYLNNQVDGFLYPFSDALLAESEGISTKVVLAIDFSESGDAIVGRQEFQNLASLKGKKIGIEGINSFSHIFVLSLMEQAGMPEGKFELKNVPGNEVLLELEKGSIDAGHMWEPTKSEALAKGYKVLGTAGEIPGLIVNVLGFNAKIVEERPEEVKAIVKSLMEARDFVVSNPEEALEIMSTSEGITKEAIASGLQGVQLLDLRANVRVFQESEGISLYTSGKKITDFYVEHGQISFIPELDNILYPRFIFELEEEQP